MSEASPLENMPGNIVDDGSTYQDYCRHCQEPITMPSWLNKFPPPIGGKGTTSCQKCIDRYEDDRFKTAMLQTWESRVPRRYRKTDHQDPRFPKDLWKRLKTCDKNRSLIIYGPDELGKARLMVEWVKQVVWSKRATFNFLQAEDVDSFYDHRDAEVKLKELAGVQVLGIKGMLDEICNMPKAVKWMKRLLMARRSNGYITVATSYTNSRQFQNIGKDYYENDRVRIHKLIEKDWQVETWYDAAPTIGQQELNTGEDPF